MPPVQRQSSFVGKYGQDIHRAHEQHKNDETEYSGFSSLPGGIENGIAQLAECEIFQVKEGKKMQGEYCFRAVGIVQKPDQFDGIPVRGMRTTIMEMLCNTPDAGGERKTFADHWAYFLNELRKLGLDTSTMDVSSDDSIQASLNMLANAAPYFWFRTWQPPTPDKGPYAGKKPQVVHMWNGVAEAYVPEDSASSGVEDNTQQAPPNGQGKATQQTPPKTPTTPQPTRTPSKPTPQPSSPTKPTPAPARAPAKPAPSTQPKPGPTTQTKQTSTTASTTQRRQPAQQFNKTTPDDIDSHTQTQTQQQGVALPDDLDALAEMAVNNDDAQQKLSDLARDAGITEGELTEINTWPKVVQRMRSLQSETTTEGDHPDSETFLPKIGEVWNYRPLDAKRGNKPSATPVACKVINVDPEKTTVILENLEDSRKIYRDVKFDALEGEEG